MHRSSRLAPSGCIFSPSIKCRVPCCNSNWSYTRPVATTTSWSCVKSSWKLPSNEVQHLRAEIVGVLKSAKMPKLNITKEERESRYQLRKDKDIIIMGADKQYGQTAVFGKVANSGKTFFTSGKVQSHDALHID